MNAMREFWAGLKGKSPVDWRYVGQAIRFIFGLSAAIIIVSMAVVGAGMWFGAALKATFL